ncbi:Hypoxia up-regulated protein 1 [Armadillidium nasatum]|uniref:Hypoxia up-regulated protein 1 n=1 Tax=Armadillidium nasatum TaxID=96803 RepID=A0A5N5TI55_9CRUS|nr:Hypoxia up-regulated protein 1 [Armadillidium nasatum]
MFRRKEINETAQNILFYDMGASFTTATIASYQTVKTKDRGYSETNPQVSVLGVGYDRSLGGLEMQLRVRDFLGRKFNEMKKTSNNVFDSPRGMAKLMKEAAKVKNVLSANTEYISQVEGVLDDKDFRLIVKREEFEELCGDLFERVREPVDSALIAAGMDIKDIHQFIIVGGNTRVPKVQSILQEIWGKELGKNINADEAAALGAVYRAADIGQGFKVMKFHVKESVVYPIDVDFERIIEKEDGTSSSKIVKRNLFALTNTYPQKKVMTFNKHNSDFGFSINYGDLMQLSKEQAGFLGSQNVSFVFVEGVTNAFSKHSEDGAEPKGIKAHFTMDESGILLLTDTEVVFEKNVTVEVKEEEESTISKIGNTLSKLFSGNDDDSEKLVNSTSDSSSENLNKSTNGDESSSKEGKSDEKNAKKKRSSSKEVKPKLVTVKEPVNFTINFLDIKPFSPENKKASIEKIQSINELENARKEKERMKNTLETYILDIHDKLSQEEYERASEEKTRTDTMQLASQLEEWLYDEGYDETPATYKDRLKSLEVLFEPIKKRVLEHRQRPEALKARIDPVIVVILVLGLSLIVAVGLWVVCSRRRALHEMINASSMFLYNAQNSPTGEKWFTDVELKTLDNLIINIQKWLEEKEEEQDNLELYKNPVLSIRSISEKIDSLDREVKYMLNKAKITKAKREREAAEAKLKEAQEKARAEKEARKKKNKTDEEEEIETEAESEAEVENGNGGEDSRQEPSMPVEDEDIEKEQIEEPEGQPEENESEQNRRKTSENLGE